MMKLVFVCGPYNTGDREENIRNATELSKELWTLGYAVVCPHLNSQGFDDEGDFNTDCFNWGYLEILSRCDIVWAMEGWTKSPGASTEVAFAQHAGIPVVSSWERLNEFRRN